MRRHAWLWRDVDYTVDMECVILCYCQIIHKIVSMLWRLSVGIFVMYG